MNASNDLSIYSTKNVTIDNSNDSDGNESEMPQCIRQLSNDGLLNNKEQVLLKTLNDISLLPDDSQSDNLRSISRLPMARSTSCKSDFITVNPESIFNANTCQNVTVLSNQRSFQPSTRNAQPKKSVMDTNQEKHILVDLSQKLEKVPGQHGVYYELVEKIEEIKAQNQEYLDEMTKMKCEYEKQRKEMQSHINRMKEELKELVGTRKRNGVLERENLTLKTELVLARCTSQNDNSKKKKEEKKKHDELTALKHRSHMLESRNSFLENEIMSVKLQLANSQSMENRLGMQLRQMSEQLSKFMNEKLESHNIS